MKEYNIRIDESKIFTLGGPIKGIDADERAFDDLKKHIESELRKNFSEPIFLSCLCEQVDAILQPEAFPNFSTKPGVQDLSVAKRERSVGPPCYVRYGVGRKQGSEFLKESLTYLLDDFFKFYSIDIDIKSVLDQMKLDTDKLNELWSAVLGDKLHDGVVPEKSQYREGPKYSKIIYDDTSHLGELYSPKIQKDIIEFFEI